MEFIGSIGSRKDFGSPIILGFFTSAGVQNMKYKMRKVNDKISFIDNPYLLLATRFAYNVLLSHFCNNFFVRRQFYQTLLKLSGAFNLQLL